LARALTLKREGDAAKKAVAADLPNLYIGWNGDVKLVTSDYRTPSPGSLQARKILHVCSVDDNDLMTDEEADTLDDDEFEEMAERRKEEMARRIAALLNKGRGLDLAALETPDNQLLLLVGDRGLKELVDHDELARLRERIAALTEIASEYERVAEVDVLKRSGLFHTAGLVETNNRRLAAVTGKPFGDRMMDTARRQARRAKGGQGGD
jgi:hypothetical protein